MERVIVKGFSSADVGEDNSNKKTPQTKPMGFDYANRNIGGEEDKDKEEDDSFLSSEFIGMYEMCGFVRD